MSIWHGATLALVIGAVSAHGALYTRSHTVDQLIPDNSANGYVNTIDISGVTDSQITDVNVTLQIRGGWNGDLYVYLVHNDTTTAILLNRVGVNGAGQDGFGNGGFNITLSDQASGHAVTDDVHRYATAGNVPNFDSGRLTGTWQPDGRLEDPASVVDGDPRNAMLNLFNGQNPNGTWRIYVADMSGGFESTLETWGLEIQAVPEPATSALLIFLGMAALVKIIGWWREQQRRA